jgi:hypothetical protein
LHRVFQVADDPESPVSPTAFDLRNTWGDAIGDTVPLMSLSAGQEAGTVRVSRGVGVDEAAASGVLKELVGDDQAQDRRPEPTLNTRRQPVKAVDSRASCQPRPTSKPQVGCCLRGLSRGGHSWIRTSDSWFVRPPFTKQGIRR